MPTTTARRVSVRAKLEISGRACEVNEAMSVSHDTADNFTVTPLSSSTYVQVAKIILSKPFAHEACKVVPRCPTSTCTTVVYDKSTTGDAHGQLKLGTSERSGGVLTTTSIPHDLDDDTTSWRESGKYPNSGDLTGHRKYACNPKSTKTQHF